jgi:hypothetical protein
LRKSLGSFAILAANPLDRIVGEHHLAQGGRYQRGNVDKVDKVT